MDVGAFVAVAKKTAPRGALEELVNAKTKSTIIAAPKRAS